MENRLCFECKKFVATRIYRRMVNGRTTEERYCMDCYQKKFLSIDAFMETEASEGDVCPKCGTTVKEIQEHAVVGCAHCYRFFGKTLLPMVVGMQQGQQDVHRGKIAETTRANVWLESRKMELDALISYYEKMGEEAALRELKAERAAVVGRLNKGR